MRPSGPSLADAVGGGRTTSMRGLSSAEPMVVGNGVGVGRSAVSAGGAGGDVDGNDCGAGGGGTSDEIEGMRRDLSRVQRQ
eukprot:3523944-Prymnesium_polylepis.1